MLRMAITDQLKGQFGNLDYILYVTIVVLRDLLCSNLLITKSVVFGFWRRVEVCVEVKQRELPMTRYLQQKEDKTSSQ
ncbi:unnamed protein product [Ilex paraguariensis]|uniref:Uncharacterized protein n=1 Tax=Ilex paraguariensis TaxID=185542 RepID=A0ABC8TTN2_9AQUA